MHTIPFYRPMFAGFAITATAILVVPATVKAQPALSAEHCAAAAAKPHGLRLGRLLSAAREAGVGQLLSGGGRGASLVGAIANTAIQAASQSQGATDRDGAVAAAACDSADR